MEEAQDNFFAQFARWHCDDGQSLGLDAGDHISLCQYRVEDAMGDRCFASYCNHLGAEQWLVIHVDMPQDAHSSRVQAHELVAT
ncbi:MAG: hypothetical protein ACKPKO_16860, partial [Candidatus Fonsibacter sp.]